VVVEKDSNQQNNLISNQRSQRAYLGEMKSVNQKDNLNKKQYQLLTDFIDLKGEQIQPNACKYQILIQIYLESTFSPE